VANRKEQLLEAYEQQKTKELPQGRFGRWNEREKDIIITSDNAMQLKSHFNYESDQTREN